MRKLRFKPGWVALCFRRAVSTRVLLLGGIWYGWAITLAQSPSQNAPGPSRAEQFPAAPQPSAAVTVTPQISNGGGESRLSTTSTVTVQGPYQGSVIEGEANDQVISLKLDDALQRALRFNLGALTQTAQVQQAKAQKTLARSSILPSVNAAISEEFERLNLRTMGVESPQFPTAVTFNFYDARAARLRENLLDFVLLNNLHSAGESLKAAINQERDARDLVILAVAGGYLQLIATQARIRSAEAQVKTSSAIYQQADDRRAAGLAPRIDSLRAHVQLQTEQQQLRSLQADLETQKLRLARMIGLPLGQRYAIGDDLVFSPLSGWTPEGALQRAMAMRSDLRAARDGVKAAEDGLKAARAERLPNLDITADFGEAGRTPSKHSTSVFSAYGTLSIPIYEGGRIQADIKQATAALNLRKNQFADVQGQVDQDVRQAFITLSAAEDQVNVAKSNVDLAQETLTQARDRFAAGVTDTVEVVQAEQAAVQADQDYISAVFEHNLGKVALARAMGNAEQSLRQLLRTQP